MALGLTQPLTEMSTKNVSWGGKSGWCVGLTTLPPSCADCLEIWEPQPPGSLWACPGLQWDCFTFTLLPTVVIYFFVSNCNFIHLLYFNNYSYYYHTSRYKK